MEFSLNDFAHRVLRGELARAHYWLMLRLDALSASEITYAD
jgi:hypothetical protein